jgi:hypothetical protein
VNVQDFITSLPAEGMSVERTDRIMQALEQYKSPGTVGKYGRVVPEEDRYIDLPDEVSIEESNELLGLLPGDEDYIAPTDTELQEFTKPPEPEPETIAGETEEEAKARRIRDGSMYDRTVFRGKVGKAISGFFGEKVKDPHHAQVDPEVMEVVQRDLAEPKEDAPWNPLSVYDKLFRHSISKSKPGEITMDTALKSSVQGIKETWEEDTHYSITKGLITLTAAEQALAKMGVVALEEFGQMNTADAILKLGQEQLHMSDIVDYYWRAETRGEKYVKAASGLAADILFDPLTYLTLGGSALLKVGGKVLDVSKMSAKERGVVKVLHEMDATLNVDGKIIIPKSKLPILKQSVQENLLEKESIARDLSKGYRSLTAGFRIPFTNIGTEVKVPFVGEIGGAGYLKTLHAMGKLGNYVDDEIYKGVGAIYGNDKAIYVMYGYEQGKEKLGHVFGKMGTWMTDSGVPLFDDARLSYINKQNSSEIYLRDAENKIIKELNGADDALINDVIAEIENTPLRPPEEMLEKFGKKRWDTFRLKKAKPVEYTQMHRPHESGSVWGEELDFINQDLLDYLVDNPKEILKYRQNTFSMLNNPNIINDPQFSSIPDDMYQKLKAGDYSDLMPLMERGEYSIQDLAKEVMHERAELGYNVIWTGKGSPPQYKAKKYSKISKRSSRAYRRLQPTKIDLERRARIARHEKGEAALNYVEQVRKENLAMIEEYYKRFPWFKELNPFGKKDWARGYLHHKTSKEWLNHWGGEAQAYSAQKEFIENNVGKTDSAAYGRLSKQTIEAANNESQLKYGIKIFETDPIAGHFNRMKEMSLTLRKHDFLEEVLPLVKNKPGRGYEPVFTPAQVKEYGRRGKKKMNKEGAREIVVSDRLKIWDDVEFLPQKYKEALYRGENVYLPTAVKTRMDWLLNPRRYVGLQAMGVKAMHTYNNLYKSAALWGPGYLGQNFFSNLITYGYAGGSAKHLYKALNIMSPMTSTKSIKIGGKVYTKEQIHKLMVDNGILNSSMVEEINWNAVVDNVGASYRYKKEVGSVQKGAKTALEFATLYRANRWAARFGDEFPKAAFFMSKLDDGYSVAGATEATNLWFFNFKDKSRAQHIASNIVPFSSFAIKSLEQSINLAKRGKLAHFTLPPKVRNILQGQYVSDQKTVDQLQETLPEYMSWGQDPIHGPLIPGANEILLQMPWALSTLSFILKPENSMHPALKMIGMLGGYEDAEYSETLAEEDFWRQASKEITRLLPPPVLEGMTSLEMNGVDIPYIDTTAKYKLRPPYTGADAGRSLRFTNEADFMEWFDKHYSNGLFNLFIHGSIKAPDKTKMGINELAAYGSKGKWIKKYFRQLTLGTAKIEPMDRDFQFRYTAIRKQERRLQNKIYDKLGEKGGLVDINSLDNYDFLKTMGSLHKGKIKELVDERLELMDKRQALFEHYDTYLNSRMNDLGIFEAIFGINEDNVYFDKLPKGFSPSKGEVPQEPIIPEEIEQ